MIDFSNLELQFSAEKAKAEPVTYWECNPGDDVLYRYEPQYDGLTAWAFKIIKKTPCGHIINVYGKNKFVNQNKHKQYAYKTIDQALDSFIYRRMSMIKILESQLHFAREQLALGQELKNVKSVS